MKIEASYVDPNGGGRKLGFLDASAVLAGSGVKVNALVTAANGSVRSQYLDLAAAQTSGAIVNAMYDGPNGTQKAGYVTVADAGILQYRDVVLADGPLGYWRLGEPSGTNAADSVGSNPGTATAGVTVNVGGIVADNTSFLFDGTQGKVSFANPALTADFSVEGWVYILGPGTVGSTDYSCFLGADGTHRLLLRNSTGEILFQMGGGNLTAPASSFALEAWTHVVYTRSGNTQKLYLNGQLVNTLSQSGASLNLAFFVGSYASTSTNYSFYGRIDEVAIYSKELTATQVLTHYIARPAAAVSGISETAPYATNAAVPLTIDTPDHSGQVVEPCIEYIPGGWNGHVWWALITGYTNSDPLKENPSLYYSDDGISFTAAPGVAFPVDPAPGTGNNADPELRLGPDGNLHGFWIRFNNPAGHTGVYHCVFSPAGAGATSAGTVTQLFDSLSSTEQVTGPVVLYDPDNVRWVMWYVDAHNVGAPYPMMRRTCSGTDPGGTWSVATTCTLNGVPAGRSPWEKHVERYGDQLHMVTTFCTNGTGGGNTDLHFGVSNDRGRTWNFNPTPFLSASGGTGWDGAVAYRGDFARTRDGGPGLYGFWYSGKNNAGVWRWGYTTINS